MQAYNHRLVVQLSRLATHRPTATTILLITSHKENSPSLGCERHISYKTNHTSALGDVVENSGSTIRVYIHCKTTYAESGTGHRPSVHSAHRSETMKVFQHM
jgi:hypothetical protein